MTGWMNKAGFRDMKTTFLNETVLITAAKN